MTLLEGSEHMQKNCHNRLLSALLLLCLLFISLTGCGISSQHLEDTYEENTNEDIHNWEDVDNSSVTTWDNAYVVSWSDIDEYSDWVYSELLFEDITDAMPVVECRVLDYQSNGKYFDGEKVYQMVGDKFNVNSFIAKYAVGTGVIVICVVLNVVTAGASTPVVCFFAGAADASVSMAIRGAAFGAATKAVITAIKSGGDVEETLYGALEGSADGYMWGAIYGAATGGFKSKYCFTEDTLVLTDSGARCISEISVGDLVYAYDENSNVYDYRPVTQVNVNQANDIVRVHVGDEVIECTPTHPFLTDEGWVSAAQLLEGNRVLSANHEYRMITSLDRISYDSPVPTYTLCVDEYHSFLVGNVELVVHNRCKPNEKYANDTYHFPDGSAQAKKYPDGVPFDADGYPIFDQYAVKTVKLDYPSLEARAANKCLVGNCSTDFKLANQAAGLGDSATAYLKQYPGYTWHHCQDMQTMQLVPQDVHSVAFGGTAHAGGESLLEEFWKAMATVATP